MTIIEFDISIWPGKTQVSLIIFKVSRAFWPQPQPQTEVLLRNAQCFLRIILVHVKKSIPQAEVNFEASYLKFT